VSTFRKRDRSEATENQRWGGERDISWDLSVLSFSPMAGLTSIEEANNWSEKGEGI